MTNTAGPSIYIPTDKNIFDALQHKKVTQSELVLFLRKRGVLVSQVASKQQLVEKISSLTMSYSDFNWIGKLLENPNRKDKTTHSKLKGDLDANLIKSACDTVKANLAVSGDDSVKVSRSGDVTTLKVTYVDLDFTKTELRQRTIKTCEIELEQSVDGIVMKLPSTKKAKEVSEQLKGALKYQVKNAKGTDIEEYKISLEAVTDPKIRSRFFDLLIRSIPQFSLDTVTSIDVYHFEQDKLDAFDDEAADARLASYVNKAALNGAGVLESTEFKQLHSQGFYIYRIVWLATEEVFEGPKVEFEAQFGQPSNCTEFNYKVRGLYPYNSRTATHNISRVGATSIENNKYNLNLRDASEKAFREVLDVYEA